MIIQSNIGEGKVRLSIERIGDYVVGRGDSVSWGSVHPFGWDKLDNVQSFLIDRFKEAGFTGFKAISESRILGIKEKWGYVRVSASIAPKDLPVYRGILLEALTKWPGLNRYLEPDEAEESVIFEGTEKEAEAFFNKTLPLPDEDIVKLETKETQ